MAPRPRRLHLQLAAGGILDDDKATFSLRKDLEQALEDSGEHVANLQRPGQVLADLHNRPQFVFRPDGQPRRAIRNVERTDNRRVIGARVVEQWLTETPAPPVRYRFGGTHHRSIFSRRVAGRQSARRRFAEVSGRPLAKSQDDFANVNFVAIG
jgi:hypothetical protein